MVKFELNMDLIIPAYGLLPEIMKITGESVIKVFNFLLQYPV